MNTSSERNSSISAYAIILAGGSGSRMGNPEKPKQFLVLGDRPILVHTVEKFCVSGLFEAVVVACPDAWIHQTQDYLGRYCSAYGELLKVVEGGATRNDTLSNAVSFVAEALGARDDDVLVTHDAVRPFVSLRIIQENIDLAASCGACDTVIPATDTIVQSDNGETISAIPARSALYQGQTPQSFTLGLLRSRLAGLSAEEAGALTDACKIMVMRGDSVGLVAGDPSNMKITYPQDLRVARALLEDAQC